MLIRFAFAALAILAAGSPGMAQDTPPEATAREIAAARDQADRIIARAEGASGYFENITDGATAAIRHKPSGMTCVFYGETPYDFIRVFPQQRGGPRVGDDEMCNTRTAEMDLSTYATRYPTRLSPEFIIDDARRAIDNASLMPGPMKDFWRRPP